MPNNDESTQSLLLDTHIWIWLINGDQRLKKSASFIKLIDEAISSAQLFVSVISVWEVGMLEKKGKIALPNSCFDWVRKALNAPGITLAELTPEIAIESTRFVDNFHGDPADRIILSTAIDTQSSLVTLDKNILSYSKRNHIQTISP